MEEKEMFIITKNSIYELSGDVVEGFILKKGLSRLGRPETIKEGKIYMGSLVELVKVGEEKYLVLRNEEGGMVIKTSPIVEIVK
jgi:hypothetical protein